MALPYIPEPDAALRARFPEAVKAIWEVSTETQPYRPGLSAAHVFDTTDGVRLIVSRDRLSGAFTHDEQERQVLHVSGSIHANFVDAWKEKISSPEDLIKTILLTFNRISGIDATGIAISTVTKGGVVHLIYPLDPKLSEEVHDHQR